MPPADHCFPCLCNLHWEVHGSNVAVLRQQVWAQPARTDRRLKRGPCLAVPLLVEEVEIKVAGRIPQLGLGAKLELGRTCHRRPGRCGSYCSKSGSALLRLYASFDEKEDLLHC